MLALFMISGILASNSNTASAAACPTNINADRCTANDLQPTGAEVVSGPAACTEGQTISATVRVAFGNGGGAQQRYDIGFFVGENGESPIGGSSCAFTSLDPLGPPLGLTTGTGPFENLDGDSCGDLDTSAVTYRDISISNLLCEDRDGNGLLDVSYVLTWDNNGNSANCSDPADPTQFYPNPPKCLADLDYDLPITVELPPSIAVTKVAVPDKLAAPGGQVTYYVTVYNTSDSTDPVVIDSLLDVPLGNLDGRGNCAVPFGLAPGESRQCKFIADVSGAGGDVIGDTVTASGADDENQPVSASDSATVTIIGGNVPAIGAVEISKVALPRSLREPGGNARYGILIVNPSPVTILLDSLVDDLYGDLDGQGSCKLPLTLTPASPSYYCQFPGLVSGTPGQVITDTVVVSGRDDNSFPVQAQAQASVRIVDVSADISVRKVPNPAVLDAPGGTVVFSVAVQNNSAIDKVNLTSLFDSVHGDLDGQGNCSLPQTLDANGGLYKCAFTAVLAGAAGDFETDVVTAFGTDDDGSPVSAIGAATVSFQAGGFAEGAIVVQKLADPTSVTEPGGDVTFSLSIFNTSPVSQVSITSLVDSVHGPLDGQGSCALPIVIPGGGAPYQCEFTAYVAGQAGQQEIDIIAATGQDESGRNVFDADLARVSVLDLAPGLSLSKRAWPPVVVAPGGEVSFTLRLRNDSASDSIELGSLEDSVYGNLDGQGDCALPQTLPPGGVYTCSFTGSVSGEPLSVHLDAVEARGTDDDGRQVTAQAQAQVWVIPLPGGVPVWGGAALALCVLALLLVAGRALRRR